MLHFIVNPYDPNFDYQDICKCLFGENKCLVMLEQNPKDHCHVQGELKEGWSKNALEEKFKQLNADHFKRKLEPKCRAVRRVQKDAEELGFQYMCKYYKVDSKILYKQVFTDEDIERLAEQSDEYRSELKSKLGECIVERVGKRRLDEAPRQLHKRMCVAYWDHQKAQDKMGPPNERSLIKWYMCQHYGDEKDVIDYLAESSM